MAPRLALACLAGALFALASPPTNAYPALWLGMAGLAYLGAGASWRRALLLGMAFGVGANVVALRFVPAVIARFTPLPWALGVVALVLLAFEQAVRWGVALAVHAALVRRRVPAPWAFAVGIFGGTFVPAVFPWTAAGGVTPWPEMVQLADTIGERGVTFLMALSAGLLAASARSLSLRRFGDGAARALVALAIPALTWGVGRARMQTVEALRLAAPTARVGLVQPSTDALERWDPSRAPGILARLTEGARRSERDGAELTVWPEAAYPYLVGHATRRCPRGVQAIIPAGVRGPVLTGLIMTGADGDRWNSAAVCRTDETLSTPQDKVHLLWFGETIPLLDRIPWVRATFTRGSGLVPGEATIAQEAGRVRASVLNCFEDTLPSAGRDAMTASPNLLVNVTNDAWFAGSAESELHLRLSALRAIESRRDLVRAVNLGVTSWVDATGRVRARTTGDAASVLIATPALLETPPTPFDRAGDAPLSVIVAGSSFVPALMKRLRDRRDKKGTQRRAA